MLFSFRNKYLQNIMNYLVEKKIIFQILYIINFKTLLYLCKTVIKWWIEQFFDFSSAFQKYSDLPWKIYIFFSQKANEKNRMPLGRNTRYLTK